MPHTRSTTRREEKINEYRNALWKRAVHDNAIQKWLLTSGVVPMNIQEWLRVLNAFQVLHDELTSKPEFAEAKNYKWFDYEQAFIDMQDLLPESVLEEQMAQMGAQIEE